MCICSLFLFLFFFGNGILPQVLRDPPPLFFFFLINELTLLVASCDFNLYISELIIVASRIRLLPF